MQAKIQSDVLGIASCSNIAVPDGSNQQAAVWSLYAVSDTATGAFMVNHSVSERHWVDLECRNRIVNESTVTLEILTWTEIQLLGPDDPSLECDEIMARIL